MGLTPRRGHAGPAPQGLPRAEVTWVVSALRGAGAAQCSGARVWTATVLGARLPLPRC